MIISMSISLCIYCLGFSELLECIYLFIFAKPGDFPAVFFINFWAVVPQINLIYCLFIYLFQCFLFWSDQILFTDLSLSSLTLPFVISILLFNSKVRKVFLVVFVIIIFCSKHSIWVVKYFAIFYIIYYFAENFYLSIHFKDVCPYLLEYFYKVLL